MVFNFKWCHCESKLYLSDKNRFTINNRTRILADYGFWKIGPIPTTTASADKNSDSMYVYVIAENPGILADWLHNASDTMCCMATPSYMLAKVTQ